MCEWAGQLLRLNALEISDFRNGALFCRLFNVFFPDAIAERRIRSKKEADQDIIHNFNLLLNAFEKKKISKTIRPEAFVSKSYANDLELLQWFYGYCVHTYGTPYPIEDDYSTTTTTTNVPQPETDVEEEDVSNMREEEEEYVNEEYPEEENQEDLEEDIRDELIEHYERKIARMEKRLRHRETEKTFYFDKLRDIEILCNEYEDSVPKDLVLEILYKVDKEGSFQIPRTQEG